MTQMTTCLFKWARLHRKEQYESIIIEVDTEEGVKAFFLFNPLTNASNKAKLQSLADATGVDSFDTSDNARLLNMIMDSIPVGHPLIVEYETKHYINNEGEDDTRISLVKFHKFDGVGILPKKLKK